ncbi:MAG: TonB-dependent receptor plug domain-containing protein [Amphiplicatus sp.]
MVSSTAAVGAETHAASSKRYELDIVEATLGEALTALSRQAETPLLYPYDLADVAGDFVVAGRYTVAQALAALLRNTDFSGSLTKGGVIAVWSKSSKIPEGEDKMPNGKIKKSLLASVAAFVFGTEGAYAQGDDVTPAGAKRADEIIVTARRREENLQEVPLDVSAFAGAELERRSIVRPSDLQFATPSMTVQGTLGRTGGSYTVRGINSGTNARTPAVIPYFSEAPGGPTDIGMPFFDLASVQILKGPQGTLFGRTAAAGAVLIEPRRPDLNELGGFLDVTAGDFDRLETTAALNIPIVTDELAIRVAYNRVHVDGFTKPIAPSSIINGLPGRIDLDTAFDSQQHEAVRAGAEWRKSDFNTYLVFNHVDIDQSGPGFVLAYANLGLANLNRTSPAAFTQILDVVATEAARLQAGGSVRQTPALQGLPKSQERVKHQSFVNVSQYDFGDLGFATLIAKNIFSYQRDWGVMSYGLDGVGGILLGLVGAPGRPIRQVPAVNEAGNEAIANLGDPIKEITEEFQLQGKAYDAIDYTFGFFYNDRKEPTNTDGVGTLFRSFSGLFAANQVFTNAYSFPNGSEEEEFAGYGEVTIDLSDVLFDGLSLTGGYRWTSNEQTQRGIAISRDPVTGAYVAGAELPEDSTKFKGSNYRFGVTQQFTPDLMAYVTISKAYLVGGRNIQVACGTIVTSCKPVFDPAIVKNYELGLKTQFQWGDANLRWNTSAYYMKFSDIQFTNRFQSASLSLTFDDNIASADMKGFQTSLDMVWRNVNLSLNYSFVDATYTDWIGPDLNNVVLPADQCVTGTVALNCQIDLSGSSFTNTPENQFSSTFRYTLPVDESLGPVWLQLDAYWQSRQWHVAAPERELHVAETLGLGDIMNAISQKPYGRLNLRVGWDNILGSNFSGAVFVNNLTDKVYSQAGSTRAYSLGAAVRLYAPPRMWGVNVRYSF